LFFSVIVPTYNRPQPLARCLEALRRQQFPHERFEVIVLDDGSDPPAERVTQCFPPEPALRLLRQQNHGPATARNRAAALARGQWLAFTDDDCAPRPDWLTCLEARCREHPDSAIGGRTVNALRRNHYSETSQILVSHLYDCWNREPARATFFTTNNCAVRAAQFAAAGGFDPSFRHAAGEDRDFWDRWRARAYGMQFAPEVQVEHWHELSFSTFLAQHRFYGRGAYVYHRLRKKAGSGGVSLEGWEFYSGMLTKPFREKHPAATVVAALLLAAQAANVAGYFDEALRGGPALR
jgi:glycosyltransferase involved in cell wall biosynthesis